jgi:hypothetical protein
MGAAASQPVEERAPASSIDETGAAIRIQAASRGRHARTPIVVDGVQYFFERMLGRSYAWEKKRGYVIVAHDSTGKKVAIKQLLPPVSALLGNVPPAAADFALSLGIERLLSTAVRDYLEEEQGAAQAVHIPAFIACDQQNAVIELVERAVTLQQWLRKPRTIGSEADAAQDHAVCWAVVCKVSMLLYSLRPFRFRHRDLHDGNVMIRILRQPVSSCEDVECWLLDLGKSMARVNEHLGKLDPQGKLVSPIHEDISTVWNPTGDTLRLVWSIQRSLLIAYGFTKADGWMDGGAGGGALRFSLPTLASSELSDMFLHALPMAQQIKAWLEHLGPYYKQGRSEDWCTSLLPEQLVHACPLPLKRPAVAAPVVDGAARQPLSASHPSVSNRGFMGFMSRRKGSQ